MCQNRHRTFYVYWKSDTVPELEWFRIPHDNLTEFLSKIPKDSLHYNDIINANVINEPRYRFVQTFVSDARAAINGTAQQWIDENNMLDEYIKWCKTDASEKDLKSALHTKMKYSKGLGIWNGSVHCPKETINALISRNMVDSIHPVEDRSLNIREAMTLMGMPLNFDLIDVKRNLNKICQNVPVCTAASMVEQASKFINGELKMTKYKVLKQNNENMIVQDFETDKIMRKDTQTGSEESLSEFF
jgi:site-specific DNA-cytosine methylase